MSQIVIPVILMSLIGLAAAIILSCASRILAVKEDKTFLALRAELPGANCGGCGFAGCDDYARALAADPTLSVNRCSVGGAKAAEALASALGREAGKVDRVIAFVHCAGSPDKSKALFEYRDIASCKASKQLYGGHKVCAEGCLGLGDCTKVCAFNAISIKNGVAYVDKNLCTGCGQCVKACPNHLISLVPATGGVQVRCANHQKGAQSRKACTVSCIGCGICQKNCPTGAAVVTDNLCTVDPEKCIGCLVCTEKCPTGANSGVIRKKN